MLTTLGPLEGIGPFGGVLVPPNAVRVPVAAVPLDELEEKIPTVPDKTYPTPGFGLQTCPTIDIEYASLLRFPLPSSS